MKEPEKTSILVHVCCAPDATVAAERLKAFRVGIYFYNPNIQPFAEYEKRRQEMQRLASEIGLQLHFAPYEPEIWNKEISGLEGEREGGRRCEICFRMRLEKTALAARELRYDLFATALTTSPHKNAGLINRLGAEIGEKTGMAYYHSDFKKKNGFKRSVELSLHYRLYRQDYCGCLFSKTERAKRKESGLKKGET